MVFIDTLSTSYAAMGIKIFYENVEYRFSSVSPFILISLW